jgi:hypothetical protein
MGERDPPMHAPYLRRNVLPESKLLGGGGCEAVVRAAAKFGCAANIQANRRHCRKDMVNIEPSRRSMASVLPRFSARSVQGMLARNLRWKVFHGSVFSATPRQKPQGRQFAREFLDCVLNTVG